MTHIGAIGSCTPKLPFRKTVKTPFPNIGGYCFPQDPDISSDKQLLFWSPRMLPQSVALVPVQVEGGNGQTVFELAKLKDVKMKQVGDTCHGIWQVTGAEHHFSVPCREASKARLYAFYLPLDRYLEFRIHAARRFWRSLNNRPSGPDYRLMPDQMRQWHTLSLRSLDGRRKGASYRKLAELLLAFRGRKEDFEVDPRKNRARRLVAHGKRMMLGDYRQLLHYPVKPMSISEEE